MIPPRTPSPERALTEPAMADTRAALDDALDALAPMSPEYGGALSDHAPMVVEALDRLGRADVIAPFLRGWTPKLRTWGAVSEPEIAGYPDARDAFAARVEADGVDGAVRAWCDDAGDGVAGAAFHGVIRIAHARLALDRADTRARRDELARALAYAAVRALPLPVGHATSGGGRSVRDALRDVGAIPRPADAPGLITTALVDRLATSAAYADAAASITLSDDVVAATRALRSTAIDLFLHADYTPGRTFTMLHVVTGMDAIARIADALDPARARRLALAGARALLAMRVAFVGAFDMVDDLPAARAVPSDGEDPSASAFGALVARAVASLNDHAIKFAATLARATDVPFATRVAALEKWVTRVERPAP